MINYKSYINALRQCAKEHKYDIIPFAHIKTTDLCNDTADLLEKLETRNTIIIPDGATNGDMIKAMFPNVESRLDEKTGIILVKWVDGTTKTFKADWWNAPYKKEVEE